MDFSDALKNLKLGKRVYRLGWDSVNTFLFLIPSSTFDVSKPPLNLFFEQGKKMFRPAFIDIKTNNNEIIPWVPTHADILSDDWELI
jgi:Protein of unknown function (DUF2829)